MKTLEEKVKEILSQHCRYCDRVSDRREYRCKNDVEDQFEQLLAAFREYVEIKVTENLNTITYYTTEQMDEKSAYNATLRKIEQSLLSGLSDKHD